MPLIKKNSYIYLLKFWVIAKRQLYSGTEEIELHYYRRCERTQKNNEREIQNGQNTKS
jgi:hypothetical protein